MGNRVFYGIAIFSVAVGSNSSLVCLVVGQLDELASTICNSEGLAWELPLVCPLVRVLNALNYPDKADNLRPLMHWALPLYIWCTFLVRLHESNPDILEVNAET